MREFVYKMTAGVLGIVDAFMDDVTVALSVLLPESLYQSTGNVWKLLPCMGPRSIQSCTLDSMWRPVEMDVLAPRTHFRYSVS